MHANPSCPHPHHKHMWIGLMLFVTGALLYLQKFEVIPQETWAYVWPGLILLTGIKLMFEGSQKYEEKPVDASSTATPKKLAAKSKRR